MYQHPQLRHDLAGELRRGLDERAALMARVDETSGPRPGRIRRSGGGVMSGLHAALAGAHVRRRHAPIVAPPLPR